MFQITPIVRILIFINVGFLILENIVRIDFSRLFGLYGIRSDHFLPFQFFSYMFLHSGIFHIFGNMLSLFTFGAILERYWGPKKFLLFYLCCGLGAGFIYTAISYIQQYPMHEAALVYLSQPNPDDFDLFIGKYAQELYGGFESFINGFHDNPNQQEYIMESKRNILSILSYKYNVPMIGASGAVFGILMAFGLLFPNVELLLLIPPMPVKAKYLVFFYGMYELYAEMNRSSGDNVAHLAHLGGMVVAFILLKFWQRNYR